MDNIQRLENIIKVIENYQTQLRIDGHDEWADKIGRTLQELFWLYYEMTFFE